MTRVQKIEAALQELPVQERWEVARWLLKDLESLTHPPAPVSAEAATATAPLPNYAERRKRIFGEKVLPNMVLASREEERW